MAALLFLKFGGIGRLRIGMALSLEVKKNDKSNLTN
jgi:hypothetical protein